MSDNVTFWDEIEGYCGRLSCRPGESVSVHVSTPHATFDVSVERWGANREVVWSVDGVTGVDVAAPDDADSMGCRWPVSVDVPVGQEWKSGFYLVTLTVEGAPSDRATAYACFVVRAPASKPTPAVSAATPPKVSPSPRRPKMLFVLGTNTWNAYNIWGGRSLYTGGTAVSFRRPFGRGMLCRDEVERDDRKARPVRWDEEPDPNGEIFQKHRFAQGYPSAIGSTGWFTHERRFVEWAEGAGYEFDYAISADLDEDPEALDGYDLMVSVGHDEYWSAPARATVERHVAQGGNLATFSGNTMFWQVRLESAADSGQLDEQRPDSRAVMVCHKYGARDTDPAVPQGATDHRSAPSMSGMWCDPLVGRPEWALLGAASGFGLYHRFGNATARGIGGFVVYRADHWLFEHTGLGYGDVLGARDGVVGYETMGCPLNFDELNLPVVRSGWGVPEATEIVAFCPSSNLGVGDYPASIAALSDQGDLEFIASRLYPNDPDDVARAKARHGNAVVVVCRPSPTDTDQAEHVGGEVVTVGTTDWVFGLAADAAVGQVTHNVLRRLAPS